MAKVYTKTGDGGETSLVGGTRVGKDDLRIELYGEVDHLNSVLGLCVSHLDNSEIIEELEKIQNMLFDLGSSLACESSKRETFQIPKFTDKHIKWLESNIDRMDSELAPLKNFILPGGSPAGAVAHVCRTTARKVERLLVNFDRTNESEVPELSLEFVNRMSDYFFILARYINLKYNQEETIWKKGEI